MTCRSIENFFIKPSILPASRGKPAKIDPSESAIKILKYFSFLQAIPMLTLGAFFRSEKFSDAFPAVAAAQAFNLGAVALLAIGQLAASKRAVVRSNVVEFLSSPSPKKSLIDALLSSKESIDALIADTRCKPDLLQKEGPESLISLYADRAQFSDADFYRLYQAAPWTKEEKAECFKILLERNLLWLPDPLVQPKTLTTDDIDCIIEENFA